MGIKTKELTNFQTPGPGQYDDKTHAVKKAMPAFSVSGKHSIEDKFKTPGPGEYKAKEKVIEGPKYGFGTGPRQQDKKDDSPGPGHYKIPTKIANLPTHALPNQMEEYKFV